jgi:hypothetical protein
MLRLWEIFLNYRHRMLGGILGAFCGLYVGVHQVAVMMTGRVVLSDYNPNLASQFPFTIFTEPASLAGDLGSVVMVWPLVIILMIPAIRQLVVLTGDKKVIDVVQVGFGIGWAIVGAPLLMST